MDLTPLRKRKFCRAIRPIALHTGMVGSVVLGVDAFDSR